MNMNLKNNHHINIIKTAALQIVFLIYFPFTKYPERCIMKYKHLIVVVIFVLALTIFGITRSTSQSIRKTYTVKLYSGDVVVQTWIARDMGSFDEQSLVFTIGDDMRQRRVRISGTYSVEESD